MLGALSVVDSQGEIHKVVGATLRRFAELHRQIDIAGAFETHQKHGRQIRVHRAVPVIDAGDSGGGPYALLRMIPHVGSKRARLLIDHFGERAVLNGIDRRPRHAFQRIAGMPYRHAGEATRWWLKHRRHGTSQP